MKIGIDGRCLQDGENTGVQEYARGLLMQLLKENPQEDFVVFVNAFNEIKEDFNWLREFKNVSIKRFRWPNKLLNFCFCFLNWPKIDKMLGGVELFIAPNFYFMAFSPNVRKILTVHDLSFERFPETFSFKRRLWHFFVNPRKKSREADKIWAVSESTAQDLISLYQIDKNKITVNYPFFNFNPNFSAESLEKIKNKYHLPEKFVLFLGTIEPRKNIESLIEGFEAFKTRNKNQDYKLVIAGEKGWLWKSIIQKALESPFSKDIKFIGFVEEEDKTGLYSLAKVFIYPSLYEGFGFPPLEAMACKIPTVASNCSSIPEVLEDGAILIDPYKPFEICLSLENLFNDQRLYQLYSEKGFKQFQKIKQIKRKFNIS